MNPALDLTTDTQRVEPEHKLRCSHAVLDAGGGGVNVARVIGRFGEQAIAIYTVGGPLGHAYDNRLSAENVDRRPVRIAGATRQNITVDEAETGQQFRFVMEGPEVTEAEWQACLDAVDKALQPGAWLVASGSLPPGVPDDFYARCVGLARERGAHCVVDASGDALVAALDAGPTLLKPNRRELGLLTGRSFDSEADEANAARDLVETGKAEMVALTLGADGALLVTRDQSLRQAAPDVPLSSAVGAGDSFTAAMVLALAQGQPAAEAFRRGVAAGAAALLTPATELCRPEDVERLYASLSPPQ
jgi:6-phosphofructokinase 2